MQGSADTETQRRVDSNGRRFSQVARPRLHSWRWQSSCEASIFLFFSLFCFLLLQPPLATSSSSLSSSSSCSFLRFLTLCLFLSRSISLCLFLSLFRPLSVFLPRTFFTIKKPVGQISRKPTLLSSATTTENLHTQRTCGDV